MKLLSIQLAAIAGVTIMSNESPRSVTMTATKIDGRIVITVEGKSVVPKTVRYELRVTGASATRHSGRTRLGVDRRILSQVSVMETAADCAILTVDEGDRTSYEDRVCLS